jgi:hypothetical protein
MELKSWEYFFKKKPRKTGSWYTPSQPHDIILLSVITVTYDILLEYHLEYLLYQRFILSVDNHSHSHCRANPIRLLQPDSSMSTFTPNNIGEFGGKNSGNGECFRPFPRSNKTGAADDMQ